MKKLIRNIGLRISIMREFSDSLWKYKLWWSIPIIFIVAFLMLFLFAAGHTGGAALIYPLF